MGVTRHFLGWDGPLTAKVRDVLLGSAAGKLIDLSEVIIVVPSRQAGRRLREALAIRASESGTGILGLCVVTPAFFGRDENGAGRTASGQEALACWIEVLLDDKRRPMKGLFPFGEPPKEFAWGLSMARMLHSLRCNLAEGGYLVSDIAATAAGGLAEPERWTDLAALERLYLDRMASIGLCDPCAAEIRCAKAPTVPDSVKRIVVAAVADPPPLMTKALAALASRLPVDILIHAPEAVRDAFDEWGRPIAGFWTEQDIPITDEASNLVLAASPAVQSREVLRILGDERERFGLADAAVGVPDREVVPLLAAEIEDRGFQAFDPAGRCLSDHSIFGMLRGFRDLVNDGRYDSLRVFLRHSDVMRYVEAGLGVDPAAVLRQLDDLQNRHLPARVDDVMEWAGQGGASQPELRRAMEWVRETTLCFESEPAEAALRRLLTGVFSVRRLEAGRWEDRDFAAAAALVDEALSILAAGSWRAMRLSGRQVLAVLLDELGRQSYYPERRPESIDLEGWLELPWNDAPLMIVTGMNEGKVPDSRMGDVFLPDALCERLGLRHDAQRMARDAFLLRTLVESRRAKGRTVLIAGKSSADGEPLKPSRLLFRCRDEHLAARAARLFGPAEEWRDRCPPSLSFRLDVRLPCDVSPERLFPASLSATAFRAYLECPFRFYLRRIVGMEPQSDRKTELDAMEFGNLVHYALQRMGEDPVMLACDDDGLVERHLQGAAEDWVMERFGRHPPIPVVIQLEAARQRLAHAARVQCEQARAGWELVEVEAFRTLLVDGMEIRARADRVERHRETGEIRILDYKTGEKSRKPEETHLGTARGETPDYARVTSGTREKRWADLQLPLYAHLFGQGNDSPRLSVGYFNMPKAVQETGVRVWDGFGGSQLASAMTCARGVISDIKALRFWPPAPKVATPDDDPLEAMFHAEIEKCVDGEAFQAFLESARARAPMPRREGEP